MVFYSNQLSLIGTEVALIERAKMADDAGMMIRLTQANCLDFDLCQFICLLGDDMQDGYIAAMDSWLDGQRMSF